MTEDEKLKLMKLCVVQGMFINQREWSLPEAKLTAKELLLDCVKIVRAIEPTDK